MAKRIIVFFVELVMILFGGITLLIALTGGFSFTIGALTIDAHSFKNPLLIFFSALLLRKVLAGSFGHEVLITRTGDRLWLRLQESPQLRNRTLLAALLLFLLTAFTLAFKPMLPGLTGTYYNNPEWRGAPLLTVNENVFDLRRMGETFPAISENYTIQWTGVIFIPIAGDYQFATLSDDGSELWLDDQLVVDNRGLHGFQERQGQQHLEPGFHPIHIRYLQGAGGAALKVTWTPPGKRRTELSRALLFANAPANAASFAMYQARQISLPFLLLLWCPLMFLAGLKLLRRFLEKLRAWKISPLTLKLGAFLLSNGLVINLFLAFVSTPTTLDYTRFFVLAPAHARNDSWQSMHRALEYLSRPHETLLYAQVFFNEGFKLQYPPTALLVFKPFAGLALGEAASRANFLSWLGIIVTMGVIAHLFTVSLPKAVPTEKPSIAEKMARLLLSVGFTLTFYPIVRSFQLGQIQSWLYCLFVLALWAWLSGRKALAGCLIGMICVIKPQLGLLALWGMLRKEWRFAGGVLAIAGIALSMSLMVFGLANHLDYLQVLTYLSQHGEMYSPNQSVNGLLHRLFLIGTETVVNPFAFPLYNPWVYAGTLVSSVLLIAAALFWKRDQHKSAEVTDLAIAALSCTIASPIAWEHHYSLLLPLFAVTLPATLASPLKRRGTILMAASFMLSSNYYQLTDRLANTPFNFLQSYLFFGALAFLVYLYQLRDAQQASGLSRFN